MVILLTKLQRSYGKLRARDSLGRLSTSSFVNVTKITDDNYVDCRNVILNVTYLLLSYFSILVQIDKPRRKFDKNFQATRQKICNKIS